MCLQPGNEQVRRTVHGGKTNCKATHREQMDQGNVWGNRPMKEYESLMSYIPNQYIREWKTKLIKHLCKLFSSISLSERHAINDV